MKVIAIAAACLFIANAHAQPRPKDDYDDGYKSGYKEGYSRGYREGLAEGEKRAANVAPPPAAVKPGPNGPISVASAFYGTSSKNCNATHWLSRRVNGKSFASVDVENSICGDPAPGQRKSLEVTYNCGTFPKTASANEHRTIYLDCNS